MSIVPAIYNADVFILDSSAIHSLKLAALNSPLRRARICLHSDAESPVQEMVIALFRDSVIEPHRHPLHKPESYHLVEGQMNVNIFDEQGHCIRQIEMRGDGIRMYRIGGNVWHQPVAVSEYVVYHEVYTGPFDKLVDVQYNDWA